MIKLRKEAAISEGELNIYALSDNVLALTRTLRDGSGYVFVSNLNDEYEVVNLTEYFTTIPSSGNIVISSVNSLKSTG